eukprot:SAG31_NODE_19152_length_610_cov_1.882583_1_plen_104_part_00
MPPSASVLQPKTYLPFSNTSDDIVAERARRLESWLNRLLGIAVDDPLVVAFLSPQTQADSLSSRSAASVEELRLQEEEEDRVEREKVAKVKAKLLLTHTILHA